MQEFTLTDLSDAGQLHPFRDFCQHLRQQRQEKARLRIAAQAGFMPSALYWRSELSKAPIGIETLLCGHVGLPGLVVWTGAAARRATEDARVVTGTYLSGTREYEEALAALSGAMCCTEAEDRAGLRQRTADEWLVKTIILGPEQLKRVFWLTCP